MIPALPIGAGLRTNRILPSDEQKPSFLEEHPLVKAEGMTQLGDHRAAPREISDPGAHARWMLTPRVKGRWGRWGAGRPHAAPALSHRPPESHGTRTASDAES